MQCTEAPWRDRKRVLSRLLAQVLKDKLYVPSTETVLESPHALRRRIVLKGKRTKPVTPHVFPSGA